MKPRFNLSNEDVNAYREVMKRTRRDLAKEETKTRNDDNRDVRYIADFEGLVDVVDHEGSTAFLVSTDNELHVLDEVEIDGVTYLPPPKESIPWLLPRSVEVLKYNEFRETISDQDYNAALFDDLLKYCMSISELPSQAHHILQATWLFHTYLLNSFQYSPIIYFFAVPERGKSRTGKGMIHVAYRGIHVESIRDAYIIRVAKYFNASLFFDTKDIWKKAEKQGTEDMLLMRFEKGATVARVNHPELGAHKDIEYYTIFGPTIIATNVAVHEILETRSIMINMPDSDRVFETDVTQEMGLALKERLLAFRARYMKSNLPDTQKPSQRRLGDILKPLYQVILLVRPEREAEFLDLVKLIEEQRKMDKYESVEAQLLSVIAGLEKRVENGILSNKIITDVFNETRADHCKLTAHRIARKSQALGFQRATTRSGSSAIVWDEHKINRLMESYGVNQRSVSPESSETWISERYDTDVSGITDDTDIQT